MKETEAKVGKYKVELDADRHPFLVKEVEYNYISDKLDNCEKAAEFLNYNCHLSSAAEEFVYMIALDVKLRPLGIFEVAHGTVSESILSPRELLLRVVLAGGKGMIVAHNHPSGGIMPSNDDDNICEAIDQAARLMDIYLADFVIVGDGTYSYANHGRINS